MSAVGGIADIILLIFQRIELPVSADTVEKLCFEKNGDFICDMSGVRYRSYEGGSRSRMKIRPDATQNGRIDL